MADHRCYSEFRGGGTGALDAEDGNNLVVGDHSVVRREDVVAEYIVKSSSASENFPFVITPDTNPGTLRHHLVSKTGLLNSFKETAGTFDEEMDSIGNWTVNSGSSGTVNIQTASGAPISKYDFSSSPGACCIQVADNGSNALVGFHKSYTLADGDSIVAALSGAISCDSTSISSPGVSTDEPPRIYFGVSDTSGYFASGNGAYVVLESPLADATTIRGQTLTSGTFAQVGTSFRISNAHGNTVFFRILRSSLDYLMFYSMDGESWNYLSYRTLGAAAAYVHLAVFQLAGSTTTTGLYPVTKIFWVREGGNGIDPWPFA